MPSTILCDMRQSSEIWNSVWILKIFTWLFKSNRRGFFNRTQMGGLSAVMALCKKIFPKSLRIMCKTGNIFLFNINCTFFGWSDSHSVKSLQEKEKDIFRNEKSIKTIDTKTEAKKKSQDVFLSFRRPSEHDRAYTCQKWGGRVERECRNRHLRRFVLEAKRKLWISSKAVWRRQTSCELAERDERKARQMSHPGGQPLRW